jgi:hypothetical protein
VLIALYEHTSEAASSVKLRWNLIFGLCSGFTASPDTYVSSSGRVYHHPCRRLQLSDTAPYALTVCSCSLRRRLCCILKGISTSNPEVCLKVRSKSVRAVFAGRFASIVIIIIFRGHTEHTRGSRILSLCDPSPRCVYSVVSFVVVEGEAQHTLSSVS